MTNEETLDRIIEDIKNSPEQGRDLLVTDFKRFITVFHYYLTKNLFIFKPFHLQIIKTLEDVVFNKQRNIVINMPVRWGKSVLVKYFMAWTWAVNPQCNNIYTSYSDDLVRKFSGEIKDIVQSELYSLLFGLSIKQDTKNKSLWKVDNGGEMRACSMGGAITGFGAGTMQDGYGGAIFIDDALKADEASSEVAKKQTISYFEETLSTRKNHRNTPFIIIMQRLAVDDLIGYIEKKYPQDFEFLIFPAIDENKQSIWPERFPIETLRKMEQDNPYMFSAQYMQNPVVAGGNLFKDTMFVRGPMPSFYDYTFITCDTASTSKTTSDYTVAGFWGVSTGKDGTRRLYLLDVLRGKIDAAQCEGYLVPFIKKHAHERFRGALIEPKGHGIYLNQRMPSYGVPMQGQSTIDEFFKDRRLDKVARANVIIPHLNAFPVMVGEGISEGLFNELKAELLAFPDGAHDDFCDVLINAVKFTYNRPVSIFDVL